MSEELSLDSYFMNPDIALSTALQANRVKSSIPNVTGLQLCYYAGVEKLSNAPKNCIHVPLEDVYNYFVNAKTRFPKAISFEGTELSKPEQAQLNHAFTQILNEAQVERDKLIEVLDKEIVQQEANFEDEKLRVFIPACRETTVMQYVAKNVAEAFEEMGYDVFYHIQDELGNCSSLAILVDLYNFNPHITVNINHLNNLNLNKSKFNFTWFQDHMPILYNDDPILLREHDYIFILSDMIRQNLLDKYVPEEKIFNQPFATNPKLFFREPSIEKENKIVFLGSDYNFEKDTHIDQRCIDEVNSLIDDNTLTHEKVEKLAKKYGFEQDDFESFIIASLVRRRVIIWLCSIKDIKVEIYGTDTWLNNPEIVPFYKGLLPYGKEMSKVYNSAKYAIAAHPHYMYQQRVVEMSACETIPLIYKSHLMSDEFHHDDNILAFSTLEELKNCIGQTPKEDPIQISKDISYKAMAKKITDIVKENTKG